ncbi:MAG: sensor histidine kinase [Clostridiales bacterium]|nr:sensor histidine kinase [Clostridiales bacterium]
MNEIRDRYVILLQGIMLALNVVAVVAICAFIYSTTEQIRYNYDARTFLDGVVSIPKNPRGNLLICVALLGILLFTFLVRQFARPRKNVWTVATLILDMFVCVAVIIQLDFNYNGLLLLVFASILAYVRDGKLKMFFVALAIVGYLVADYELLAIYLPLYNVSDYIGYYTSNVQQYLFSIYNILISLNIILFVIYCVYVINSQRNTLDKINQLYHDLQIANEQLKEYADMSVRMAQTRERNRLAREIHDTLGHTLTGIATGLDACIATIDLAPEQTKKQLELLARVSREGLEDVRRSVGELRPDALERLHLDEAISKMIMDMSQVSDVEISFETDETHLKYDEDEENAIYRVIQESITNAVRHGKAKKIWITMKRMKGELRLVIRDDGCGCEKLTSGFGLKHMKERIELLNGTIAFDGGDGFTVTARIPIRWGEKYD